MSTETDHFFISKETLLELLPENTNKENKPQDKWMTITHIEGEEIISMNCDTEEVSRNEALRLAKVLFLFATTGKLGIVNEVKAEKMQQARADEEQEHELKLLRKICGHISPHSNEPYCTNHCPDCGIDLKVYARAAGEPDRDPETGDVMGDLNL